MVTLDLICRYLPFTALTGDQMNWLAHLAQDIHICTGDAIFHQGEYASDLYVLLEGHINLFHTTQGDERTAVRAANAMRRLIEDGQNEPMFEGQSDLFAEYWVGEIQPVEIVGISVLIPPHRFTATARAAEPSRLLRIDGEPLRRLYRDDLPMAYTLLQATACTAMRRLHSTRQKVAVQLELA